MSPCAAAVALGLMAALAPAGAATVALAPSEALACMTPAEDKRVALTYPPEALERKEGGVVKVELRFDAPDGSPSVKVLGEPTDVLASAVRRHVRQYRVPCLREGQTATLRQDFQFDPSSDGRKVLWTNLKDVDDPRREAMLACMQPLKKLDYPLSALRREEEGIVALKVTYSDASNAPQIEVLDDTPHSTLIEPVRQALLATRLPCHQGAPVAIRYTFDFKIEGGGRFIVRDMALMTFLRAMKNIGKAQVYFDLNQMKCPFDLRVQMWQPTADNRIGEVGESVPERAFFIDWLSRQRLNLPAIQQNRLIGQMFNVAVPCGTINLSNGSGGGASQ